LIVALLRALSDAGVVRVCRFVCAWLAKTESEIILKLTDIAWLAKWSTETAKTL
jgi:hypothetical protein